jgi:hypothetical protein
VAGVLRITGDFRGIEAIERSRGVPLHGVVPHMRGEGELRNRSAVDLGVGNGAGRVDGHPIGGGAAPLHFALRIDAAVAVRLVERGYAERVTSRLEVHIPHAAVRRIRQTLNASSLRRRHRDLRHRPADDRSARNRRGTERRVAVHGGRRAGRMALDVIALNVDVRRDARRVERRRQLREIHARRGAAEIEGDRLADRGRRHDGSFRGRGAAVRRRAALERDVPALGVGRDLHR